ncbi:MAG: TMEM175 family protein [Limisphaerales bacterium]
MTKGTERLEAFSDGVFGIALTLLVLEFQIPNPDASTNNTLLLGELRALWPSLVAFCISFVVVLIMWINHHELIRLVRHVDYPLLYANGGVLLLVTFVPFPTKVLARHLGTPAANASAVFYCATFFFVSLSWSTLLASIIWKRRLVKPDVTDATLARVRKAYIAAPCIYGLAVVLAFWNAVAGLALCTSLWLVWMRLCYGSKPAAI